MSKGILLFIGVTNPYPLLGSNIPTTTSSFLSRILTITPSLFLFSITLFGLI